MKAIAVIQNAVRSAKSRLQERSANLQAQLAVDAANVASEIDILERHAALVKTCAHLAANYNGVATNLETMLAQNPLRTCVGNLRGYNVPGIQVMEVLAAYDVAKRYKSEILAELKAQTTDAADKQLRAFEIEHKAVLEKHGLL